jgi:hypothetical protein
VKKIVLGCGLVMLVLAVVGGAGAYYFVYRPAKAFVTSMAQIGEVAELDKQVTNRHAFTAPEDGTLTPAQVQRFAAVQEAIHGRLGARAREFETKYKALGEGQEPKSISEAVGAFRDLLGIIAEAKRAQVDGLNAQRFSVDEYDWVKRRFYEASGVALVGVDFKEFATQVQQGDFSALQKLGQSGESGTPASADTAGVSVPVANRTLVAPYKQKMDTWAIYGVFGL